MTDLIFCRTPLQSLIAQKIALSRAVQVTFIYWPTSNSEKHKHYFDKFSAYKKIWIPYRPLSSDTLTDALVWWRIPLEIRKARYQALFIASIGSVAFSIFIKKNTQAEIYTFDDGTYNLSSETFWRWINHEPFPRRLIKYLLRGIPNPILVAKSTAHFTIFPKQYVVNGSDVREISLTDAPCVSEASAPNPRVRVLLGSWFQDPKQCAAYLEIVKCRKYDLFVPHPATVEYPYIGDKIKHMLSNDQLKLLIAEDIVFILLNQGLMPEVYGFDSTALFNLSRYVSVKNIDLREGHQHVPVVVMQALGVQSCSPDYLLDK